MKSILTILCVFMCSAQANDLEKEPKLQLLIDAEKPSGTEPSQSRYRSAKSPFAKPYLATNTVNLNALRAAGCMQFSSNHFENILSHIQADYPDSTAQSVCVFDLREEFHVFIQGYDAYWRLAPRNDANAGISLEALVVGELNQLNKLKSQQTIAVPVRNFWKINPKQTDTPNGQSVHVFSPQNIETERALVQRHGAHYVRIPVTDHCPPTPDDVDLFVAYLKDLPRDTVMLFHCQGGYGRTTTFMTLADIWLNHDKATCDEIVSRQAALPYAMNLRDHDLLDKDWKKEKSKDRLRLVEQFYDYVHTPSARESITFREFTLRKMFEQ